MPIFPQRKVPNASNAVGTLLCSLQFEYMTLMTAFDGAHVHVPVPYRYRRRGELRASELRTIWSTIFSTIANMATKGVRKAVQRELLLIYFVATELHWCQ